MICLHRQFEFSERFDVIELICRRGYHLSAYLRDALEYS
jgi:hypothetical protein